MARLPVRLQPGAAREGIDGWDLDADGRPVLKVRVRARPVEGEANAALIALIAQALGVPRRAVDLARGGQSRLKRLEIDGLDEAEVRAHIDAHVTER
jgi:Uncharacterized conserved protein